MLSYLPFREPSWLNGPPEPNRSEFVGTCKNCGADHYDSAGDPITRETCSCSAAMCCSECPKCSQCGDKVCAQCSVSLGLKGGDDLVCADCYQTYLEDLTETPQIDPVEGVVIVAQPRNAQVAASLRDILNAYSAGVR